MSDNVFSVAFALTNEAIEQARRAGFDLVQHHKNLNDSELSIAVIVAQDRDGRASVIHKTKWDESSESFGFHYSRTAYLWLTNPEEARSPDDLVYVPEWSECLLPEMVTRSGKVFRPVGKRKRVWRLHVE